MKRRKFVHVKKIIISGKFLGDEAEDQTIQAINDGNAAVIRKLLRAGIDPNMRDENNQPIVSIASRLGNLAIVDELLEKNAHVNASSSDGRTALHVATKANHKDIVKRLLDAGASTTAITLSGLKPIDLAKYETPIWYMLRDADIKERQEKDDLANYNPLITSKQRKHSILRRR